MLEFQVKEVEASYYQCKENRIADQFLAHLSRRLKGELIVYWAIRRPLVRASVSLCVRV